MSKLLIWDIDGTLINCYGSGREALEKAYMDLYGIPSALSGISMPGALDLTTTLEINERHQISNFDFEGFFRHYSELLTQSIKTGKGIAILGGIDQVLETLQQPGLYHVIGTGNCRAGAYVKLNLSGLMHYFEEGAYGDEVKTRFELLALAKQRAESAFKLKFTASDVMVIGDTPMDIAAAKQNEFVAVATTTGYYDESALEAHHPDFMIDHFTELLGIIENQWPKGYWK